MIEIKNLNKTYNKNKRNQYVALSDVSLSLPKTGLVCILGESGSGKTTLLNALGGLDDFNGGEIDLALEDKEISLKGYNPKIFEKLRSQHFGYIFQNYYLLMDYTVAYNVKLALSAFTLSEEEKDRRVDYVLEMLGLGRYKKKPVSMLSGGQRQRVSIARALVKAPSIILADEPTGNLDEENTIKTMSILKNISKNTLVLLVSHERRIAEFFSDRIIEVQDGKVIDDRLCSSAKSYERDSDPNIYLKDMECDSLENALAAFNTYYQKEDSPESKPQISISIRDNKIFIDCDSDHELIICGPSSGVVMKDSHKPVLKIDDADLCDYHLDNPGKGDKARLSLVEVFNMALNSIKTIGRRQVFMLVIFLISAVLLSTTLAELCSTLSVTDQSAIGADPSYVRIDFTKVTSLRDKDDQWDILEFAWSHLDNDEFGDSFYSPDIGLFLEGHGFTQTAALQQRIWNYSYVDINHLNQDSIIYGQMSSQRDQVVVDISVIDSLMASNGIVSSLYDSSQDFIGAKLRAASSSVELTISGICDTGNPDIYIGQNVLLNFDSQGFNLASEAELLAEYPDMEAVNLTSSQCLVREGLYDNVSGTQVFGDDTSHEYQVVGTFPDQWGVDYVLSDEGCRNIRDLMIYTSKYCMIYSDNPQESLEAIEAYSSQYSNSFRLDVTIPYDTETEEYISAHQVNVDAKKLITLAAIIIALIFIYFTMKGQALARMEELTVYRLLGISSGSIKLAYAIEMFLMTSITSLPAVLIVKLVISVLNKIPSLSISVLMPGWLMVVLILIIYIIHILLALLPVGRILKRPPAVLARE